MTVPNTLFFGLTVMIASAIYDASTRIADAIRGKPEQTTEAR